MRGLALVAVCLLAGCDRPHAASTDVLAADPTRLRTLRAQCRAGEHDDPFCAQVARADLRRFLSGQAGSDEYQRLTDLPSIPASFDGSTGLEKDSP